MGIEKNNRLGTLNISKSVVASIAGGAATEVYGVVGMASQHVLKDGIAEILKKENFAKGIEVKINKKNEMIIGMYVVIAYGIKLSEVVAEIQKQVRFVVESALEVKVVEVNVFVQDVKVIG
jgi:uncharacterized alkaline shock family protein YloU